VSSERWFFSRQDAKEEESPRVRAEALRRRERRVVIRKPIGIPKLGGVAVVRKPSASFLLIFMRI